MTRHHSRRPSRRLAGIDRKIGACLRDPRHGRRFGQRRGQPGDGGFVLLETLVTISLIAVVMAAFTTFFVNSVAFTNSQRATQIATQIANSAIETISALPASDLVSGHDAGSVKAQFRAASTAARPWLSGMTAAVDRAASPAGAAGAAVPTTAVTQTLNNVLYSTSMYLGTCVIPAGATVNANCSSGAASTGIGFLRVVVAVTWAGTRCPPTGCAYVTSTLLSTADDPLFSQSPSPPAAPVLTNPGDQISAVGDTVVLETKIKAVPAFRVTITTGILPAGLMLDSATGRITGTPSTVRSSASITLTVTDGFGRVAKTSFSWTVLPGLTATAPPAQGSFIGTALTLTLPAATGGSPGYSWSDPGATLPAGLAVSTVDNLAMVTGTPTTRGVFPVTLTVTDATTTRKATVSFSWTIDYPPIVAANPGSQTSTVSAADSATLSVTGGSGSFAWTGGATLPAGLTLSGAGVVSGTPTTAGVTSVVLLITDTVTANAQSVAFTWTVYARPSVASPGNQNVTVGASVSLQLATTCPNAPCSYVLNGGPASFGINASGLLTGTVTSGAQTFTAVTLAVTDSSAVTVPSASFTVTVNAAPTVSSPGDQIVAPGAAVSLNVAGRASGGTAPLTYSAANLPSWLTLNASTGLISGIAPGTTGTMAGIVLTISDSFGVAASSTPFSWTIGGVAPTAPLMVTVTNGDGRVTPTWTAPTTGPVVSYTATASPGGATCTTTTLLSCAIGGLTNGTIYSVTVRATNGIGTGSNSVAVSGVPYPAAVMSAANGMTLWLDGADPAVLLASSSCTGATTTTAIGCWKDKSGQAPANNFIQATAGNQPGVSTWNGLTAANFADISDVLNSVNPTATYQTVILAANVTNSAVYINLFSQAGVDYNVRIGSGAVRSAPVGNDWSFDPAGTFNWLNGSMLANANGPLKIITSDQARSVKSFTASVSNTLYGRGVVGQIGDVITFNRTLSTLERRTVEEYLAHKWAVPIAPQALVPQAPTAVTAARLSSTSASVSWVAPVLDGGAPISGYTVTSAPGNKSCSTTAARTCTVSGLTATIPYTFTVTATNPVGIGPASTASNSVTP